MEHDSSGHFFYHYQTSGKPEKKKGVRVSTLYTVNEVPGGENYERDKIFSGKIISGKIMNPALKMGKKL